MKVIFLYISIAFFIFASVCFSQTTGQSVPESTNPQNIIIPKPGKFAHWVIKYSYGNGEKSGANEKSAFLISEVEYILGGEVGMEKIRFGDGRTKVIYLSGNLTLEQHPRTRKVMAFDISDEIERDQIFRTAYPGLEWVRPEKLKEMTKVGGQDCFYFRDEFVISGKGSDGEETEERVIREAWISAKSLLPVAFRKGQNTGRYIFLPPPAAALELPPAYRDYIKKKFENAYLPGRAASFRR